MALDVTYADGGLTVQPLPTGLPEGAVEAWALPLPFEAGYQQRRKRSFVTLDGPTTLTFPSGLLLPDPPPEDRFWVATVTRVLIFARNALLAHIDCPEASVEPRLYYGPDANPENTVIVLDFSWPFPGLEVEVGFEEVEVTAIRAGLIAYAEFVD